ncbi:MAG: DUF4465 domain-containing protein [Lentisphaerae bacterium]|nr:DUF4465 domain-containing protein [Lentisphaerota bacterium]
MRSVWLPLFLYIYAVTAHALPVTVDLDAYFIGENQFINDTPLSDGPVTFDNTFTDWGGGITSWSGFAFSTVHNTTNGTWANQYAAAAPLPSAYAVAYHDAHNPPPAILFDIPAQPLSLDINNTTYTAATLRNGDGFGFARPFTTGDHYLLHLTAYNLDNQIIAATNHPLADFRDGKTHIQTNWITLDLSWMPPAVAALELTLETTDIGAWGPNTPTYAAIANLTYAYSDGSDGIAATNPAILCWADAVAHYSPGANVTTPFANPSNALGPASSGDGANGSTNVVSLGDSGSITLTFPAPITDLPGPDFAVFENAFSPDFLEFAFVEVSSDGTHFTRFPNHATDPTPIPAYPYDPMEPESYGGLAGKHLQGLGTPFDLRALKGTPGLDTKRITHVRLVDVIGDGTALDSYSNPIRDPHPTTGSGGFDLEGIGILHPLIEISTNPATPPPALPNFTTQLQHTPTLQNPTWQPAADRSAPGFYRWSLIRD